MRRPIVLRCPGPLVALRGLAALYRVPAQQLAALLPACEARARTEGGPATGALRRAVSDALGARPLAPTAVHYFHAARLRHPHLVLERGLLPFPTAVEAIWRHLGDVAAGAMTAADWASLRPAIDGHDRASPGRELRPADAEPPGPRGWLVCDVLLRPTWYGVPGQFELPAMLDDLSAASSPIVGFDLAERYSRATIACIVEYRRRPAPDDEAIDAALWFVAAALRGGVSPAAVGGHDAHGSPIAACDIVSVRAVANQTEWTHQHPPQRESARMS